MKTTIILPDKKYKRLKEIAHKKRKSLAKIINDALDETYFVSHTGSLKNLKGICRNDKISDKDLESVKIKFKGLL